MSFEDFKEQVIQQIFDEYGYDETDCSNYETTIKASYDDDKSVEDTANELGEVLVNDLQGDLEEGGEEDDDD